MSIYPPSVEDEGGVEVPHEPTEEEVLDCAFAERADTRCPAGKNRTINCRNCSYHPWRRVFSEVGSRSP